MSDSKNSARWRQLGLTKKAHRLADEIYPFMLEVAENGRAEGVDEDTLKALFGSAVWEAFTLPTLDENYQRKWRYKKVGRKT